MFTALTKTTRAGLAALALSAAIPVIAAAQPAQHPPMQQPNQHRDIKQRIDRILKRVGASADQSAKVHAIAEAAKADIGPMHAAMRESRKQLRTLLSAPQIDTSAIEALRAQQSATMDKISQRITAAIIEAANVLTPDQRAKLATMRMGPRPGAKRHG